MCHAWLVNDMSAVLEMICVRFFFQRKSIDNAGLLNVVHEIIIYIFLLGHQKNMLIAVHEQLKIPGFFYTNHECLFPMSEIKFFLHFLHSSF